MARPQTRSSAAPARRRQALALIVTLGLGTLLGWALFGREGDEATRTVDNTRSTAVAQPKAALAQKSYPKLGVSFGRPSGWKASVQGGVVKLSATDATVSLAVSISGGANREKEIRRSDQAQMLRLFKPARVIGRTRGKLGPLPVLSTEIAGTTKRRRPLRILTTAATSRFRTYSLQVFSTPAPPAARLSEVRTILDSFRFAEPS